MPCQNSSENAVKFNQLDGLCLLAAWHWKCVESYQSTTSDQSKRRLNDTAHVINKIGENSQIEIPFCLNCTKN